ncbi:MAG: HD domain-containing protein, partial [Smithellaceae bacterium]|nr:HD domain-containing protein [Smithellaceae bacterium]
QTITKRASLNIENKLLYESVYSNVIDTFQSLVTSIQARDHYTEQHSIRVADMSVKIARLTDCKTGDLEQLKIAAALHDIGKISVPDIVLLKPEGLSAEEVEIMKNHCSLGESILQSITLLSREKKIIRHHHERWDGQGYPDGISGKNIPFFARILAVADSFDAMVNERPYRRAMPLDQAFLEIKNGRGSQFDPAVVDTFLSPDFRASIPC